MNARQHPIASDTRMRAALHYASMGWSVFPAHSVIDGLCTCGKSDCKSKGKHPRIPHGYKAATSAQSGIKIWASLWETSNIAIAAGFGSGIFVVDVDPRNKGNETFDDLVARNSNLPDTLTAATGGGGRHYVFKQPPGFKAARKTLGAGIDIQSDGSYFIVDPSVTTGAYTWLDCDDMPTPEDIAEAPDWLIQLITGADSLRVPVPVPPPNCKATASGADKPGGQASKIAATLSREQIDEIRSALDHIHDWNNRDCWKDVGMALHSTGAGEVAYKLWTDWSKQSDNHDVKDQLRVWKSFTARADGIGIGTLFKLARPNGWKQPPVAGVDTSGIRLQASQSAVAAVQMLVQPWLNCEPVDLWGKIAAPVARDEFFPPVVSAYAFEVAEVSGFDPGFVAMASMVALAGSIHDGIKIQCKRNDPTFLQSARLWVALVGQPSAKKTPIMKKVFGKLFDIEAELREQHTKDFAKYQRGLTKWKSECKKADKDSKEHPVSPEPPSLTRLVVDDTTIERLQMVLAQNPRGVISVRDELSGWFASMGAYGDRGSAGKDEAGWLQLHEGGPRMFDRVGRPDVFVDNWSASLIGGIQPAAIKGIAHKLPHNGLMQRLIPVIGQRRQAHERQINMKPVKAFDDLLGHLHCLPPSGALVMMDEDADAVRKRVFDRLGGLMTCFENDRGRLSAHIGKWEGIFCRLVLIVHCADCAGQQVHPTKIPVSQSTAQLVERLMFRYLMPHLMCFYEEVLDEGGGNGELMDDVKKLGEHILAKGWESFTDRDITQAVKRWRHRDIKEKADRYATLVAMGWIMSETPPDHRGIAPRYLVNPSVHTKFPERAVMFSESMKTIANLLNASPTRQPAIC